METLTNTIRPVKMEDVVGLDYIKNTLRYDIEGAKELGRPLPHYILSGPPGCSKTTVAQIIAGLTKGNVFKFLGTDLKSDKDVEDLLYILKDNDVVYVEEAHSMGTKAQTVLLEWLENGKFLIKGEDPVDAPRTCFIFPTTNLGKILRPLRTRCSVLHTSHYNVDELKQIILRASKKLKFDLSADDEALTLLAQCSRGNPRTAVNDRLDSVTKIMAVDKREFNVDTVEYMLEMRNIHEFGLEHNDLVYCNMLYDKMMDNMLRPVSQNIMGQSLGFEKDLLETVEGYLHQIQAITISSRGREITPFGVEIIDRPHLTPKNLTKHHSKSYDDTELREKLEDSEFRSKGMRGVAELLGMRYGPDNHIIKKMLNKLGYGVKQKMGIYRLASEGNP